MQAFKREIASAFAGLGVVGGAGIAVFLILLLRAAVLAWAWNHFAVALGAVPIGMAMAFGIMLTLRLFSGFNIGSEASVKAKGLVGFAMLLFTEALRMLLFWGILVVVWAFV